MGSIQNRLTALFILALVITVGLSGYIVFKYERLILEDSLLTEKTNSIQLGALKAQVSFKTQVQEWKNILLRGYDDELYEQYLKSFRAYEAKTRSEVEALVANTSNFPELNKDGKLFLVEHKKLGFLYREALPVYKLALINPHITTDKYVRGIDRAPIKLLSRIVDNTAILYNSVVLKRKEQFSELKFYITIIFSLTIIVLVMIFWFSIKKGISQPLNNMSILLKDIAEGGKDLTLRLETHNVSELKLTAYWFNVFISNIQGLMTQINTAGNNLSDASYESSKTNERTNQAITSQQAAMTQVSISMQQMTENIKTVADNAQLTAESTKSALKSTSVGYGIVVDAVSEINLLSGQINSSTEIVRQLADESSKVNTILNVITAIAEQTNLLALNAAIEAARAGEHGRGFAVVADEVRNLSQKTYQATVQIQQLVNNMQVSSKDAVDTMVASHEQVTHTVELANRAGSSLEKINSTLAKIDGMNKNIAESCINQSESTMDINSTIISINTSISNTIGDAKQNTSDSSDLAQLATLLHMLINEFKVGNIINEDKITSSKIDDDVELF